MKSRLIGFAAGMMVIGSMGLGAQTSETKTKTKTTVSDGKEITTTGCLDHLADGRYVLNSVGGATEYVLIGSNDFAKHVGERVEVKGNAAELGDGKVKTETRTTTEAEHGKDQDSRVTVKREGNTGWPVLGVKSVKKLASSCS